MLYHLSIVASHWSGVDTVKALRDRLDKPHNAGNTVHRNGWRNPYKSVQCCEKSDRSLTTSYGVKLSMPDKSHTAQTSKVTITIPVCCITIYSSSSSRMGLTGHQLCGGCLARPGSLSRSRQGTCQDELDSARRYLRSMGYVPCGKTATCVTCYRRGCVMQLHRCLG